MFDLYVFKTFHVGKIAAIQSTMIFLLSFVFVALSNALACSSGQCLLQAVSCMDQPSQCENTTVGLVVMDKEHAKFLCGNASLELVTPGDATVNDEMKRLCPSAAFFDIRPKASANASECNSFVVESSGAPAPYFNWDSNEPNNGNSSNLCSKGPVVEDCVGFKPLTIVGISFRTFFWKGFRLNFSYSRFGSTDVVNRMVLQWLVPAGTCNAVA